MAWFSVWGVVLLILLLRMGRVWGVIIVLGRVGCVVGLLVIARVV